MPFVTQVTVTLPHAFEEKYLNTFSDTHSDVYLQSSTCSQYKMTEISDCPYMSPLIIHGSISDVELTWVSAFLAKLDGKSGMSIVADHRFTIKDMLHEVVAEFNLPTFMEGRAQLPPEEVQGGRKVISLCIHVE